MSRSSSVTGRTWDQASSPGAARLARRFEADWRAADRHRRPEPGRYLPDDPAEAPGVLLALLRAEMSLRIETGEPLPVERYRHRHPALGDEAFVALIYEELCLREEAGECPDPTEYLDRFPELAGRLHRVFDIHGLVGAAGSTALHVPAAPAVPLPEAGQTIAGFYLVEELGRGAFARVFRAEERQLADRPVALKVARAGSREPQTLARLQHTHIVPVHSYRIDPATGLHFLCMPYLGEVTLARLLDDAKGQGTRSGTDLLAALDRIEGRGRETQPSATATAAAAWPAGRRALERRTFVRAIAWWGARLAEALHHAHERGVLHRDVKPSNVLVTGDGLPMLLDFNLAWETRIDDPGVEPGSLGGTLAYMAPEHLEGLADGLGADVDSRADIYSLGVVLYEAMGERPFAPPLGSLSVLDALLRSADQRRAGAPRLGDLYPEVPPEFDAVVMRCLAPDPARRYASAAELAADLQAVADDAALPFAREPLASRSARWLRRHRVRVAVGIPLILAPVIVAGALFTAKLDRVRGTADRLSEIRQLIAEGKVEVDRDRLDVAEAKFATAEQLARGARDPVLEDAWRKAREQLNLTRQRERERSRADRLFDQAATLRLRLLDFIGPPGDPSVEVEAALAPFYVLRDADWTGRPDLLLLDERRRASLADLVNDILFLWTVALDRLDTRETRRKAAEVCRKALAFAEPKAPWVALSERINARLQTGASAATPSPRDPLTEGSARACFQWSVLCARSGRIRESMAWLDRATRLDPSNYWYHYYLAYRYEREQRDLPLALHEYGQAVAVRPDLFWARLGRAGVYGTLGAWDRASEDLRCASRAATGLNAAVTRLQQGIVHQALGDEKAARTDYESVMATAGSRSLYGRAARFDLASLDVQAGDLPAAGRQYEALIREDPRDTAPRKARALLALRLGDAARADADLTHLAAQAPPDADVLGLRAEARLALRRLDLALADAEAALRLEPRPARERLRTRILLARGDVTELRLDRPGELDWLPAGGPGLTTDLRGAADHLRRRCLRESATGVDLINLAIVLAALGETAEAAAAADRAVAAVPSAIRPILLRARLRRHDGHFDAARDDVARGLALEPDDPRLLELRGNLAVDAGDPRAALADLDRALALGGTPSIHASRAQALVALDRTDAAIEAWSFAAKADPDDPRTYLGRARAFLRRQQVTQALGDLEKAINVSGDRAAILAEIAHAYAQCVSAQPTRRPRVERLARRAGINPATILPAESGDHN